MARKTEQLTVGRRRIPVSNLDKVLYPGTKFTKADVINYLINVSKYILPHLKDHPITLKRFPDGVFGESFYEKDAPAFTPAWVKTVPVIKTSKNTRAVSKKRDDESALTKRTMTQIASAADAVWQSNRR
jgi:bifunctional non-homologous end joining protein LigD